MRSRCSSAPLCCSLCNRCSREWRCRCSADLPACGTPPLLLSGDVARGVRLRRRQHSALRAAHTWNSCTAERSMASRASFRLAVETRSDTTASADPRDRSFASSRHVRPAWPDCSPISPLQQRSMSFADGRLSLAAATDRYDLLILDAYSSEAIPLHLLSREAMRIYRARLLPRGLLALHISNRHFDLAPVGGGSTLAAGCPAHRQRMDRRLLQPSQRAPLRNRRTLG